MEFGKSDNFIQQADRLINELKSRLADEEEFVHQFTKLTYAPDQTSLLLYIFDRFNNYELDPGQCVAIYDPDPKLKRRNYNIEHWLPQSTKGDDTKDNIGNLLPLYFRDNSSLGNAPPAEKLERLNGEMSDNIQVLAYVRGFIQTYGPEAASWNDANIANRAQQMSLEAYRKIWKI